MVVLVEPPIHVTSDANYVHDQATPSASWTVAHNLGKRPAVQVIDTAGTQVEGDVTWLDDNSVRIIFSAPFSGKAYCN